MKFKNLSVGSFGKISDKEISFSDKLNIIYGKNEAGKSTLSAYMKYMLYGFSSQKGRSVDSNEKTKYMPWDSDVISGSATIENCGEDLRIERRTGAKSTLKVTDAAGKELLFGKEPGEEFFGLDEAAFSKMAFIRQNDVSADKMSNLSDVVQNAVYSADETVDIEKARKKLSDFRNVYRSKVGKKGKCYELEEKIRELRYDFDKASELHKTLLSAEAKLAETRAKIKSNEEKAENLEKELENISGFEASLVIEKILAAKKDLDTAKEEYEKAKESITFSGKTLSQENISLLLSAHNSLCHATEELDAAQKTFEKAKSENTAAEKEDPVLAKFAGRDVPDIRETEKSMARAASSKRSFLIFGAVALLAAILFFVGYFALPLPEFRSYLLIMGTIFVAVALILGFFFFRASKNLVQILSDSGFESVAELERFATVYPQAKEKLAEKEAHLRVVTDDLEQKKEKYARERSSFESLIAHVSENTDPENADAVIEKLKKAFDLFTSKENELKRCESVYDTFLSTNDLHALSEAADKYTHTPERDKKTVLREYEFFKKANANLLDLEKQYIKQAASPASAIRKPSEILAERRATEALLERAAEKADAAELALLALEQACDDLKGGISPRIAAKAGEFFSLFTDGKYSSLEVSGEFGVGITHGGIIRDSGYLSRGTADAAYLSLRLSLCENLFREKPPLFLDEVFAYVDDERLEKMLDCLVKLSENYQIFLFTCHEREKKMLEKAGGVNIIEL